MGSIVPLDTSWPVEYIQQMVDLAEIQHIFTKEKLADSLLPLQKKILPLPPFKGTSKTRWGSSSPRELNYDPKQSAYILFTSGSTGTPKAVTITHENLAYFRESVSRLIDSTIPDPIRRFAVRRRK